MVTCIKCGVAVINFGLDGIRGALQQQGHCLSLLLTMTAASDTSDKAALLEALQAHGRDFLASFDSGLGTQDASSNMKRKRRKLNSESTPASVETANEPGGDEWQGFGSEEALTDSQSESSYSGDSDNDCRHIIFCALLRDLTLTLSSSE